MTAIDCTYEQVLKFNDNHGPDGRFTSSGDAPDPLHSRLVDYKPDRSLSDPTKTKAIDHLLPHVEHVSYGRTPFLQKMHELMGVHDPMTMDVKQYMDARKALFAKQPEENLPLHEFVVTQKTVNLEKIAEGVKKGPDAYGHMPIDAVRYQGKNYIMNGHHRVVSAAARGDRTIPARVLDLGGAAKGDVQGHPFHGNQWSTGAEGSPKPVAEDPISNMLGKTVIDTADEQDVMRMQMFYGKKWTDHVNNILVYHGTSSSAVATIKAEGLIPARGTGSDKWWADNHGGHCEEMKAGDRAISVYFTPEKSNAKYYAQYAATATKSTATVLTIKMPIDTFKAFAKPDENSGGLDFRAPIRIPPQWIVDAQKLSAKESSKLRTRMGIKADAPEVYAVFLTSDDEPTEKLDFDQILKFNPYHDEGGRFSTGDGANFVSIGDRFAKSNARDKQVYENRRADKFAEHMTNLIARGVQITGSSSGMTLAEQAAMWEKYVPNGVTPTDIVNAFISPSGIVEKGGNIRLSEWHGGTLKFEAKKVRNFFGGTAEMVERRFDLREHRVEHEYLTLDSDHQGAGTVKEMFKACIPLYQRMGIQGIDVHANLNAGGYAWAKYGLDASSPRALKLYKQQAFSSMQGALRMLHAHQKLDSPEVKAEMEKINDVFHARSSLKLPNNLSSLSTPALDARTKAFAESKNGVNSYGNKLQTRFLPAALGGLNWQGRLELTSKSQMAVLSKYVGKKLPATPKPKKP